MKIRDILAQERPTLSFEMFPPETEDAHDMVERATVKIAISKPDFTSVTYGAGGGTSDYTMGIASDMQKSGVTPLAHLTYMSSTQDRVYSVLEELRNHGIENVLAPRGDIPADGRIPRECHHASELTHEIKQSGGPCTGATCYPEGHVESINEPVDTGYLKEKVEAGCDSVVTQMFLDNSILYSCLYRTKEGGITIPVIAGTMPVTSAKQIKRITQMLGIYLPSRFLAIVDEFGDNPAVMKQIGIAYVMDQTIDLIASDVGRIHVRSMNGPDVATEIRENLSEILWRRGVSVEGKDEYRRH